MEKKNTHKRLDNILKIRYPDFSKRQIQEFIAKGLVFVNQKQILKPGSMIDENSSITVNFEQPKFVSRAGFKLEKALQEFKINITGLTALDSGLSTGGFTDCLLQNGAAKVFGIDVGHGQVHEKIQNDPRIIIFEKTNLRYLTLEQLGSKVDLVTLDLSFISILKVIDTVCKILKPNGFLITLIKPQFEAEPGNEIKRELLKTLRLIRKY